MYKLSIIFISLLILIGQIPYFNGAPDDQLIVQTDRSVYSIGDTVIIQVQFIPDPGAIIIPGMPLDIVIEISTPTGWPLEKFITIITDAVGEAKGTYALDLDPSASLGTYSVIAYC